MATRRAVLAGAATLAGGSLAGCTTSGTPAGGGEPAGGDGGSGGSIGRAGGGGPAGGEPTTVAVLAAGSLQHALETGLVPAVDVPVTVEAHGSATVARMVAEGQRDPDVVTVADTALFDGPLHPPWYSTFTSNAVVLAYDPETEGGRRIAEAGDARWFEPLLSGEVRLGRTDPDQDPLGYRALFALELASRYYEDAPDLAEAILDREQVYPETALISGFETGAIDAAFAYRNMAIERDYAYVDLPGEIDLGDPAHLDEWYSTVSYTLPTGEAVQGGVVGYGSTIRHPSEAALAVFDVHTTGDYLAESGFLDRAAFPVYTGDVPEAVLERTPPGGSNASDRPSRSTAGQPGELSPTSVSELTILV